MIVGPREALGRDRMRLRDVNWLGDEAEAGAAAGGGQGLRVAVKVRSTRPPAPATLWLDDTAGATVVLDVPEPGIAPGQACVFYDGERVLGGGWIAGEAGGG